MWYSPHQQGVKGQRFTGMDKPWPPRGFLLPRVRRIIGMNFWMCTLGFKSKTSGENAAILNFSHLLSIFSSQIILPVSQVRVKNKHVILSVRSVTCSFVYLSRIPSLDLSQCMWQSSYHVMHAFTYYVSWLQHYECCWHTFTSQGFQFNELYEDSIYCRLHPA